MVVSLMKRALPCFTRPLARFSQVASYSLPSSSKTLMFFSMGVTPGRMKLHCAFFWMGVSPLNAFIWYHMGAGLLIKIDYGVKKPAKYRKKVLYRGCTVWYNRRMVSAGTARRGKQTVCGGNFAAQTN